MHLLKFQSIVTPWKCINCQFVRICWGQETRQCNDGKLFIRQHLKGPIRGANLRNQEKLRRARRSLFGLMIRLNSYWKSNKNLIHPVLWRISIGIDRKQIWRHIKRAIIVGRQQFLTKGLSANFFLADTEISVYVWAEPQSIGLPTRPSSHVKFYMSPTHLKRKLMRKFVSFSLEFNAFGACLVWR